MRMYIEMISGKNTSYDSQISTYKAGDFAFSKFRERYKKCTKLKCG